VLWAAESRSNWNWLWTHGDALCAEYAYRFQPRYHASTRIIHEMMERMPPGFTKSTVRTPFPQVMPDEYKVPNNSVEAYRRYYRGSKLVNRAGRIAAWTRRSPPEWVASLETETEAVRIAAAPIIEQYFPQLSTSRT
jgi:hypothetical protein